MTAAIFIPREAELEPGSRRGFDWTQRTAADQERHYVPSDVSLGHDIGA